MEQTPRLNLPYPSKGENPFYDAFEAFVLGVDRELHAARENFGIVTFGGGDVAWDAPSGLLSWSEPIKFTSARQGFVWIIPAGSITLADAEYAYAVLPRGIATDTTVTMKRGSIVPTNKSESLPDCSVLAFRYGDFIFFRSGQAIETGTTARIFEAAGGGGGAPGLNGRTILSGVGAPSNGYGELGDFYIDLVSYKFYGPKSVGAWLPPVDLIGPVGPQGPEGPAGPAGADGGVTSTLTSTYQAWIPTDATVPLLPRQVSLATKATTLDDVPVSAALNWTGVPAFPATGVLKVSAELLAKSKVSGDYATFDIAINVVFRGGVATIAPGGTVLDNKTSEGVTSGDVVAEILWDVGTSRPYFQLLGSAAEAYEWGCLLYASWIATTLEEAPVFDLASIPWTMWLVGDDALSTGIAGKTSAGTSNLQDVTSVAANTLATDPVLQNGHKAYQSGTDNLWSSPTFDLDTILNPDAFTFIMVIKPGVESTGTIYYNSPYLWGTGGGGAYWGFSLRSVDGTPTIETGMYDGAFRNISTVLSAGYQTITFRLRAGQLQVRKGLGAWSAGIAVGSISLLTNFITNFSATGRSNANVLATLATDQGLTDLEVTNVVTAIQTLYGI